MVKPETRQASVSSGPNSWPRCCPTESTAPENVGPSITRVFMRSPEGQPGNCSRPTRALRAARSWIAGHNLPSNTPPGSSVLSCFAAHISWGRDTPQVAVSVMK